MVTKIWMKAYRCYCTVCPFNTEHPHCKNVVGQNIFIDPNDHRKFCRGCFETQAECEAFQLEQIPKPEFTSTGKRIRTSFDM
jgi:hypothetical protein